jgi:hypothetical protein
MRRPKQAALGRPLPWEELPAAGHSVSRASTEFYLLGRLPKPSKKRQPSLQADAIKAGNPLNCRPVLLGVQLKSGAQLQISQPSVGAAAFQPQNRRIVGRSETIAIREMVTCFFACPIGGLLAIAAISVVKCSIRSLTSENATLSVDSGMAARGYSSRNSSASASRRLCCRMTDLKRSSSFSQTFKCFVGATKISSNVPPRSVARPNCRKPSCAS